MNRCGNQAGLWMTQRTLLPLDTLLHICNLRGDVLLMCNSYSFYLFIFSLILIIAGLSSSKMKRDSYVLNLHTFKEAFVLFYLQMKYHFIPPHTCWF